MLCSNNGAEEKVIKGEDEILQVALHLKLKDHQQLLFFLPMQHPLPLIEVRKRHCSFRELLLPHPIPRGPVLPSPHLPTA